MPATVIVFDCEFLTDAGAPQRFWCGPTDPDPMVVQIGAVALSLSPGFEEEASFDAVIRPVARDGSPAPIPPFFSRLTGLTAERVASGQSLEDVLAGFARFGNGAPYWCWGNDEVMFLGISAWISGVVPPLPARRFGNATRLLLRAGVPQAEVEKLRSPTLPAHFGLTPPKGRAHDAVQDARCVAMVLQHLLREGRLLPEDLMLTG